MLCVCGAVVQVRCAVCVCGAVVQVRCAVCVVLLCR